ncbi:hypothetical protein BZA77DRAFT_361609 [Pyronema omphalodes]|nr:hypothetical protein BZA77DRAFT_361609 [Pyronema omphalodes]
MSSNNVTIDPPMRDPDHHELLCICDAYDERLYGRAESVEKHCSQVNRPSWVDPNCVKDVPALSVNGWSDTSSWTITLPSIADFGIGRLKPGLWKCIPMFGPLHGWTKHDFQTILKEMQQGMARNNTTTWRHPFKQPARLCGQNKKHPRQNLASDRNTNKVCLQQPNKTTPVKIFQLQYALITY